MPCSDGVFDSKMLKLTVGLSLLIAVSTASAHNTATQTFAKLAANLEPPIFDSTAWVLMEAASGWIVAGKNESEPLPPASLTKLMTNYVIFDLLDSGQLDFTDQVAISERAWRAEGSRMFAEVDSRIELKHLLKSTIIQSGNDAAIALAEHAAGSEEAFSALMNMTAEKLELSNSFFENSTGLPSDRHRMSAADIARLALAMINNYPQYFKWYSEKQYSHNGITQYNRNKLLWKDSSIDGLKTGHTEKAGFCLVGTAQRHGQRWIAVVMGAADESAREDAVQALLNYAFAAYQSISVLDQQGGVAEVPVYSGDADIVRLKAAGPALVVVPTGRESDLEIHWQLKPYYRAPVSLGQAMGVAHILLDRQPIAEIPLVAVSDIKQGGWWKQMTDSVELRLRQLPGNFSDNFSDN